MQLVLIVSLLGLGAPPSAAPTTQPAALKTLSEKASYTIGVSVGQGLKRDGADVVPEALLRGLTDALAGSRLALTDQEMTEVMKAFQKDLQAKLEERMRMGAERNKKEGEAFLAANKDKDGVKVTASGLQYKVLATGTGASPKATDTVVTHYRGALLDGTEFDSSYKRNEPAEFAVNRVIAGWTEALQLMKVGDKWQLFVPSNLAYGPRGAGGGAIGPNATLIFEVELLEIK